MTLQEVFKIIDSLSQEERAQVSAYLQRQQDEEHTLRRDIAAILATARPAKHQPRSIDPQKLERAIAGMWSGLQPHEIEAIAALMNEEYVETDADTEALLIG